MTAEVYFLNGKFTAQRVTGVQRVATCLVAALDAGAMDLPGRWTLLCPPGGRPPALRRIEVRTLGAEGLPLHAWEQFTLPRAARGAHLVNLSGTAPCIAGRQALLAHDAAVFDQPQAYTTSFVRWYRFLYRRLGKKVLPLMTVSQFSRRRLALHLGLSEAAIAVVPAGADHLADVAADPQVMAAHGIGSRPFLLAIASRNPTKNIDALVTAFGRLCLADWQLVIVGGDNGRVFERGAVVTDPPGVVRTGPLDDAQLVALYRAATALVMPSLYEGFGLPPIEAMSLGCPVTAANAGSLPEVCGDAALYFDPHSGAAIERALRRITDEAELRAVLRQAGLQRASGLRWEASARTLLAAVTGAAAR